tara:strand:+ start:1671 stop:2438 length:768 start_codon:yes stop_codon:yes gene_type:complete
MKNITSELWRTTIELFPTRRESRMVIGVILLTVSISVSEILMAHFFSLLILPTEPRNTRHLVVLGIIFLILFSVLRLINFAKEHYRLNVFEKSLSSPSKNGRVADSWRWATAMELTSLLTLCGRLFFVSALLFFFSPILGLCNFLVGAGVFQVLSWCMRKQFKSQHEFRKKQHSKDPPTNAEKVRTRVISGEIGSLLSSVGLIILLGTLILLYANDVLSPAKAFVLFIAIRMIGQIYSGLSSGLMRFARARVLSG